MTFEFQCNDCQPKERPADAIGRIIVTEFEKTWPHGKKAPALGSKHTCPSCGRRTAVRVFSSGVTAIVRGKTEIDFNKHGQSMMTNVNGQDVKMTFFDHPHTDPAYRRHPSLVRVDEPPRNPSPSGSNAWMMPSPQL